jgi:hypothetical protein
MSTNHLSLSKNPALKLVPPICFTPRAAHKLLLEGKLPAGACITGSLSFNPGSEPIFPRGVHVRGSLSVAWCGDGMKLGPDLTVDGIADFSMTSLETIPPRLNVTMALDVSHTYISDFPLDMQVGWKIIVAGNVTKAMRERVAALERQQAMTSALRRSTDSK